MDEHRLFSICVHLYLCAAIIKIMPVKKSKQEITQSLFEDSATYEKGSVSKRGGNDQVRPLADRMRPRSLDEFVGQKSAVGPGTLLRRLIEKDELRSIIFWGPPGTGKTTLAEIIAYHTKAQFMPFSAVVAGIKEVRAVMADAERFAEVTGRRTVLFIDEIHRFNRAQQDAFLPYVETGTIILIGATTENPSFEVNAALLSRSRVIVLELLSSDEIVMILRRAIEDDERGLGRMALDIGDEELQLIAGYASGDARVALNTLELAALGQEAEPSGRRHITIDAVKDALQRAVLRYDKSGEEHYNIISAFIKSIRNSDADAALYWLARMLEAGEDPRYVARRLVHHASEDIGLADPFALNQAVAAMQAAEFIGLPECKLALAQATIYLARAPKSNSVLTAYLAAAKDALETEREGVPLHLRNAPTSLMKQLGYGSGYKYAHDMEEGKADMECLPPSLRGHKYYIPGKHGWEDR
jgi:putative ATPase